MRKHRTISDDDVSNTDSWITSDGEEDVSTQSSEEPEWQPDDDRSSDEPDGKIHSIFQWALARKHAAAGSMEQTFGDGCNALMAVLAGSDVSVAADEPCCVCGSTEDDGKILLCDGCELGFHTYCVGLKAVPQTATWRCPACANREDVAAKSALRGG